ncbi:MAG TPA: PEP-utilizing enzyme, partial [Terriglobia bacterium]|nr:PEP-utilizing enzyme [Terriglobia bacterium]
DPATIHVRASQFATSSFGTLRGMTKRWLNDTDGTLASRLVTGIGSIVSTNPASAIYEMSQIVMADPALIALFEQEPDDQRLLSKITGPLHKSLQDFLDRFGHRGFREAEFRYPCWREQPASVLGLVRRQMESRSPGPAEIAKRQADVSNAAREEALGRLSGMRRKAFIPVLESARKHIAAREEMKDLLLQFLCLTRRVIAISQRRLDGLLETPDDIYFLLGSEVAKALQGNLSAADIRPIVQRRQRDFEWSSLIFVPKIQDGVAKRLDQPPAEQSSGVLSGIPVSPGRVEGRARVVLDPSDAVFYSGEILIAPVTDVAWTPLFLRAAAVVVEVGGPLSHGSIVAREFGIPAVTAVAHATTRIHTGAWIQVDGNRGAITLVKDK